MKPVKCKPQESEDRVRSFLRVGDECETNKNSVYTLHKIHPPKKPVKHICHISMILRVCFLTLEIISIISSKAFQK